MRRLLAAAFALLAPPAAAAITVPDDYLTVQAALEAAVPGDTILVKDTPGPYHEKITFPTSGAPGAYISLEAFPGHAPILDGTGVSGANMILIDSKSYVKVVGFEIRDNTGVTDGSGIRLLGAGSHVELRNNRIHDIRGQNAMGITVYGTEAASISDLIIDGNEIYDCEPARSEAITLNGNVERFEVTNNVVRDVNNIGIDFIGGETDIQPDPAKVARDGVCRGNQVVRARSIYEGGFAAGIYVDGGRDIVIERNIVSECDLGIEIGAENAGIVTSGIAVRDNVVHGNDKVCIVFGGFSAGVGRVRDSSFLNNTCYRNDTLGVGFGELWIQYAEDNAVRNNVFHATEQNLLVYSESGNVGNVLDYNLWFAPAGALGARFVWQGTEYDDFGSYRTASGQDAGSVFGDALFVAPGAGDFHIASGSPGVNAGDPLFVPGSGETDLDGAARVNGPRVDIGADELSCGDSVVDPGETCDDGDLVDCDGCDSNCTASATCGNRIACLPEQCDDGNGASGDCCSATCQLEAPGAACSDGDACTRLDQCDGAGSCGGDASVEPVCRAPILPQKSMLQIRDKSPDTRDSLLWRWTRGQETFAAALGDPIDDTDYTLCVYDQSMSPQPRLRAAVPAGGFCPGGPCWKAIAAGFVYNNRNASAAGLRRVKLKAGDPGKASILVRGRGTHLPLPTLGLTTPVTVQLRNGDGECWGATFSNPLVNDGAQFKARSD